MVKPIPDGYHSLTPYIIVEDGSKAIDFYTNVLGAEEIMRMEAPGGKIGHAELRFGNSHLMLADENPNWGAKSPKAFGGSPQSLMLYVENVDELFDKAVRSGAQVKSPVKNQFYGDRSGSIIDPFGHEWTLATHVEDVTPEEMGRRAEEAMKNM